MGNKDNIAKKLLVIKYKVLCLGVSIQIDLNLTFNLIFHQQITIWNGMTILWDKKYRIFIRAKENMVGQTAGLCGNFNEIQDDDKWASDGITHEDIYEFASLWQVKSIA